MPQKLHLIISGAVLPQGAGEAPSPAAPVLPRLRALLAAMDPTTRIECTEDSPSTPCELALAEANALPGGPGHIPWAAFETGTVGLPCAFLKLCHLQVGADHILLLPPEDLGVDAATSGVLMAAMAPYFLEDGITLQPLVAVPGTWLATGEPFRNLRTVSTAQLAGRRVTRAMLESAGGSAAVLRRLQNEMQMLLYTHPLTDARAALGLPAVNSFWVSGTGALPPGFVLLAGGTASDAPSAAAITTTSTSASTGRTISPTVTVPNTLRDAAVLGDWAAWTQAWQAIDSTECAALLRAIERKNDVKADTKTDAKADVRAAPTHSVKLTLCGDRSAQTYIAAQNGLASRLFHKIKRRFNNFPTSYIISLL